MNTIKTYRDLLVWQKAMLLVNKVYKSSAVFPDVEKYALTSQIRRSVVSIPSNMAEGYGRNSIGDYLRFLNIAMGSLFELQTQLEIALNQAYVRKEMFDILYEDTREIERMLRALIKKLK